MNEGKKQHHKINSFWRKTKARTKHLTSLNRNSGYIALGVLIIAAFISLLAYANWYHNNRYNLNPQITSILSPVDKPLLKQVKYQKNNYYLTASSKAVTNGISFGTAPNQAGYGMTIPSNLSAGIKVTDPNSKLDIVVAPETPASFPKVVDNRFVYPMANGVQDVYTMKSNGLSEDLILAHGSSKTLSFGYNLKLPKDLTPKLLADGSLGIYSTDSNITNGHGSNLLFIMPVPTVKLPNQARSKADAHFSLTGSLLKLNIANTASINGPIDIDPSVIVTGSSLPAGNNEGDASISTSSITEGGITGGDISGSSWSTSTVIPATLADAGTTTYNGYVYEVGGYNGTSCSSNIYSAQLNNTGGITGSWTTITGALTSGGLCYTSAVAFNGYLFVMGGCTSQTISSCTGSNVVNTVYTAKIGTAGSLSSPLTTATSLTNSTFGASAVAYNNYLYLIGGSSGASVFSSVYTAPINSDGSISSWATSTTLNTAVFLASSVVYNGYIYTMGGCTTTNCSSPTTTVQYAAVNCVTNGNNICGGTYPISTWTTASGSPLSTAVYGAAAVAYQGYIYLIGGFVSGATTTNTVFYNMINSDGSLNAWIPTSSANPITATALLSAVAYNNNITILGGGTGSSGSTIVNTVSYNSIQAAGYISSWNTEASPMPSGAGTTYTQASSLNSQSATSPYASSGYIYSAGGTSSVTNLVYQASVNGGGSTSSFTTPSTFTTAVTDSASVIYNNTYMVIGGILSNGRASGAVQHARISTDGTVGAWGTNGAGSSPNLYTYGETAVAFSITDTGNQIDQCIWLIGGYTGTLNNSLSLQGAIQYDTLGAIGTPNGTAGGTLPGWQQAIGAAPSIADFSSAFYYAGRIYVVGGKTASGDSQIYSQAVPTNNQCTPSSSWTSYSSPYSSGLDSATGLEQNGNIYIVGGEAFGGQSSTYNYVYYLPISSLASATSSSWSKVPMPSLYSSDDAQVAATIYNNYLYLFGGGSQSVNYGFINGGGSGAPTTTNWNLSTNTLYTNSTTNFAGGTSIQGNAFGASVVYNGCAYLMGGMLSTGNSTTANVEYAKVQSNGDLSSWTTSGVPALPSAVLLNAAVVVNGYIYAMSGAASLTVGPSFPGSIWYNKINPDCSLGFSSSNTSWQNAVYSNSGGTGTANLYVPIEANTGVSYGNCVYSVGGTSQTQSSYTAQGISYNKVNPSTGRFNTAKFTNISSLPQIVGSNSYTSSFAYDGRLYVIGGGVGQSAGNSDTYFAPINNDCSLGTWQATTPIPMNAASGDTGMSAYAYNGYAYFVGGETSVRTNNLYLAAINSDGTLGPWQTGASVPSTVTTAEGCPDNNGQIAGFDEAENFSYNGYLYLLGGAYDCQNGGFHINLPSPYVYYVGLNTVPRVATYSTLIDTSGIANDDPVPAYVAVNGPAINNLGVGIIPPGSTSVSLQYAMDKSTCKTYTPMQTAENPAQTNNTGYSASFTANLCSGGSAITTSNARYAYVTMTVDNSQNATWGGSNNAAINGFNLYYHPQTNYRLRGGQTFTGSGATPGANGTTNGGTGLQSLDAPP